MNYKEFINNILETRGRFACGDEYHERHHIIPKCLGGTNDEYNLIDLFAKEHFEAHRLLALENSNNKGLQFAWWNMCQRKGNDGQNRYTPTPEEYEEARIEFIKQLKERTPWNKGIFLSEEHKKKISNSLSGEKCYWYGKHHSEETKKKLSEIFSGEGNPNYGKPMSKEQKKKISESNSGKKCYWYGKHHSQKTKQKMSTSHKGKRHSEETRKKMSDSLKGKNGKHIRCIETGEIYESITVAEKNTNISHACISNVCNGKQKTAGGYHWEFVKDEEGL